MTAEESYMLNFNCLCVSAAAPVWVKKPQDSNLEEGKPGYLHCHAQANPQPEVTWNRGINKITSEVCHHTHCYSLSF